MSGHSKWSNIKRTKGVQDAKRGALFSKLSRDIIAATQIGESGDINFNTYLRLAVNKAKAASMTSDRIENAINKGLGKNVSGGDNVVQKTYEAYGFDGVMLLIDCETDNPNRTISDLRTTITRAGGKVVAEGSLSWQFAEKGVIVVKLNNDYLGQKDEIILEFMTINGVEDILEEDLDNLVILAKKERLKNTLDGLKRDFKGKVEIEDFSINKIAKNEVNISEEVIEKNNTLIEKIKENPDVINVWDNIS